MTDRAQQGVLETTRPEASLAARIIHLVSLLAGPMAYLACVLAPPLPDVSIVGMRTLGIFLWTIIWWIGEPVPIAVSSFLAMALLVLMGVQPVAVAFAA